MITPEQERIAKKVLDAAFEVHSHLGPGLLESTYQTCLLYELVERDIHVESEKSLPIAYKGIHFNVQSFKDGIRRIVLNDKP
ncbi:MAG: GxxExxY protein, partial [Treponema sp.]|nr:GxxExxY protein [Treponema sp.]